MNITIVTQQDLRQFLEETRMRPSHLAKEAGVSIQAITRVLKGPRLRCGIDVSTQLAPLMAEWFAGRGKKPEPGQAGES